VRGAAAWALSRLLAQEEFDLLARTQKAGEPDPQVREEWARIASPDGNAGCFQPGKSGSRD
jgi:hypothetical protein